MQLGIAIAGFVGALAIGVLLGSFLERRNARTGVTNRVPSDAEPVAAGAPGVAPARVPELPWFERLSVDGFWIPAGLFAVSFVVYAIINKGRQAGLDYFVPLADAFLHGHISL